MDVCDSIAVFRDNLDLGSVNTPMSKDQILRQSRNAFKIGGLRPGVQEVLLRTLTTTYISGELF